MAYGEAREIIHRSPKEIIDFVMDLREYRKVDEKLGKLSKVLLSMNSGRGPDILAVAEIESERAANLLRQRLNKELGSKAEPYRNLLFKENKTGRHIAPAILTRLPVGGDRTSRRNRLRGNR